MELVVGKIGRAHGLAGEVGVEVRTDRPDQRFAVGAVVATQPASRGPLMVVDVRRHHGRLLIRFEGVSDRTAAEALIGTELVVDLLESAEDDDAYYDHELVGLRALDADGAEVGTIRDVLHMPAHDLLVVGRTGAADALVPFVAAIVPQVDLNARTVTVLDPGGLLDLAESEDI